MSTPNTDENSKKTWTIPAMQWIASNVFEKQEDSVKELFERYVEESGCTLPGSSVRSSVMLALRNRIDRAPDRIGMRDTIHLLFVLNIRVEEEFRRRIRETGTTEFGNGCIQYFRSNDGSIECQDGRVTRNEAAQNSRIGAQPNQGDDTKQENSGDTVSPPSKRGFGLRRRRGAMSSRNATSNYEEKISWTKRAKTWLIANVFEKQEHSCAGLFRRIADEIGSPLTGHSVRCSVFHSLRQRIKCVPDKIGIIDTIHLLYVLDINVDNEIRRKIEKAGTVKLSRDEGPISYFRANDGSMECKDGRVTRNEAVKQIDEDQEDSSEDSDEAPEDPEDVPYRGPYGRHSEVQSDIELEPETPITRSTKRSSAQSKASASSSKRSRVQVNAPEAENETPRRSGAHLSPRERIRAFPAQDDNLEWDEDPGHPAAAEEEHVREEILENVDAPEEVIDPEPQIERKPIPFLNIKTEHPPPVQNIKQEKPVNEPFLDSYDILYYLRSIIDVLDHEALSDLRNKIAMTIDRPGREACEMPRTEFVRIVMGAITGLKWGTSDQMDPLVGIKFKDFLVLLQIQLVNMQFPSDCELIQIIKEMAMTEKMIQMSRIENFIDQLFMIITSDM